MKLCSPSPDSANLYCCDPKDTSFECGHGTKGKCTNEKKGSSGYILCPYNADGCRSDYYNIDQYDDSNVYADYVPKGGSCVYRLVKSTYHYNGIRIVPDIIKNVDVSIFKKKGSKYKYQHSIDDHHDDEYKIKVDDYDDIYIVVLPSGKKTGEFSIYANVYGNTELSGGAITGISIGSVALFCIFVTCCCCW